jgi:hypothetical protein
MEAHRTSGTKLASVEGLRVKAGFKKKIRSARSIAA